MKRLNKYNDETIDAIKEFIEKFSCIFPGLLSEEVLIDRIILNLDENIEFDCDLGKKNMGIYDPNKKKIFISKNVISNGKKNNKEQTLFHEFIHVITYSKFLGDIRYRKFVEGLTSLAEEKYFNYKNKPDKINRVNNYIYEFVKELDFVTNGELLEQFLTNPNNVYKMFLPNNLLYCIGENSLLDLSDIDNNDYKEVLSSFSVFNDKVIKEFKKDYSDTKMYNSVTNIENIILEQYYLRVAIGKEKFDIKKLVELYYSQIYPNVDSFFRFIDKMIDTGEIEYDYLIKYGIFYDLYLLYKDNMDIEEYKNVKFGVREVEWIASKVFGYSSFIDSDVSIEEISFGNISINDLSKMNEFYKNNIPVFTKLIEYILSGYINIDDIINCNLRLGGEVNASTYVKNILNDGNYYYRYYNTGKFSCDSKIDSFILEEDDTIKYIFDEEDVYSSIDYCSLIWKFRSSNIFDSLHEYFIRYEDSDCIYVNRYFSEEILDDENCQMIFYILKDYELYKVSMEIRDNVIYENINKVNLKEESNKLFVGNLKEKTMCKSI